ncbi:hypothetical protein D0T49_06330 [Paludibacter sp. 221]|uniref:PG0541 family transporter-associated protein n=1 Tax=Paludibacter sp. 221 TaxID=2302939 RepID=UPI0013D0A79E|nr:PG0541 family transporter-associated protein [Paludibacter sp. 221]NDV46660.1 hypothetical protein [Paludibacter sp. 221]
MKSVFIAFEQSLEERVLAILSHRNIRGFTLWNSVLGTGSKTGDPHMNSHAWAQQNSAIMTIVEDEKVQPLLEALEELNQKRPLLGIRAFVWTIEGGM